MFDQKLDDFLEQAMSMSGAKRSFEFKFGYNCFGPFLYGFSLWLQKELSEQELSKAYFLARDGKILLEAYKIIFPRSNMSNIEIKYLHSSRRSWIVPTFAYAENIEECLRQVFQNRRSLGYILKSMGISEEKLRTADLDKSFASIDELLNDKESMQKLESYFPQIKLTAEQELQNLIAYFRQEKLEGRLALVDIGWYGRTQTALTTISDHENLDLEAYGFYTGLRQTPVPQVRGYLFQNDPNYYFDKFRGAIQAYEALFISKEGSTQRFIKLGSQAVPEQEAWTSEDEAVFQKNYEIQAGALQFLRDFSQQAISKDYQAMPAEFWFSGLEKSLVTATSINIARNLGQLAFDHGAGEIKVLAAPKSLPYYIFHPQKLKTDIVWLSGFFTNLLKIKAPYYKLLKFLAKNE
jgi:predicted HAD superfamily hydrolase